MLRLKTFTNYLSRPTNIIILITWLLRAIMNTQESIIIICKYHLNPNRLEKDVVVNNRGVISITCHCKLTFLTSLNTKLFFVVVYFILHTINILILLELQFSNQLSSFIYFLTNCFFI